jgi:hypothetical protein
LLRLGEPSPVSYLLAPVIGADRIGAARSRTSPVESRWSSRGLAE